MKSRAWQCAWRAAVGVCALATLQSGCANGGWFGDGSQTVEVVNRSRAVLQVQPYEANSSGELRFPISGVFQVGPGQAASRSVKLPEPPQNSTGREEAGRKLALAVTASGMDGSMLGTWIVPARSGGLSVRALEGRDGTTHLFWSGGEEISAR